MADLNWYVEALGNGWGTVDEGGWTPTNKVPTSNHLGGTAFDYNWNDHPMGPKVPDEAAGWQYSEITKGPEETASTRTPKILRGYGLLGKRLGLSTRFHAFPEGYDTYQNAHTQDFINRKINSDTGTSRFQRREERANSCPR